VACLALPQPPRRDVGHVSTSAGRARDTGRPAASYEVSHTVIRVREEDNSFLQSFGIIVHGVIMKGESRKSMGQTKALIFLWRGMEFGQRMGG